MRFVSTNFGWDRTWLVLATLSASAVLGKDVIPFRTDGANQELPWFQLEPGEFPPAGSAHYISGELISLDHVNRTGILRTDRNDGQLRSEWDLPFTFTMLPFGSLSYHGAPAELRDIPLGTHLHGHFYLEQPSNEPKPKTAGPPMPPRISLESAFSRCFTLEDDFSYCLRQQRTWRVDAIDLDKKSLTLTGITGDAPDLKPRTVDVTPSTRVWKGHGIGTLTDLSVGQSILINLTNCTLRGPGRCVSIWLDAESRAVASAHQTEIHRQFTREHGLAGWVDHVDNKQGIMSVALFAGFDEGLLDDFTLNESISVAVAEDNLRTWDQFNDKKSGPLLSLVKTPPSTGDSGVRVQCHPSLLLEGFRPKRVVRLWASRWKLDHLPREERLR